MNRTTKTIATLSALIIAGVAGYGAAILQSHASMSDTLSKHMAGQPVEPGQAAFAAIAEIVTILSNLNSG